VEASAFEAPAGLTPSRIAIGAPLLRLRSDEQLVALFRDGHDEAFRVIHDRYQKRLLAYVRQMLPRRPDAEDALQEVFVRAYFGLRAHERELSLGAWLFRVAHNRCIDELRRPTPPPPEILEMLRSSVQDPVAEAERRDKLRRLIADVRRLPDQQRSALLQRELGGMSYSDLAGTLGVSVPAVKSLLVRARVGLAQAAEARDTACSEIREALVGAHDSGVRPDAMARRHMRDCSGCRTFRREMRGMSRSLAALAPIGPLGLLAKVLGISGGVGGSTGGAGGSAAVGTAVSATGASSAGIAIGSSHVAALIAAAVATAGAVEIQHTIAYTPPARPAPASSSAASSLASPSAGTQKRLVMTSSGQVVVVPASAVPAPSPAAAGSTPQTLPHQATESTGSTALTGAFAGGSESAAQKVDSSGTAEATSWQTTPASGNSTIPSTGGVLGAGSVTDPSGTASGSSGSATPGGSSSSGTSSGAAGSGTSGTGTRSTTSSPNSSSSGATARTSGTSSPSATTGSASSSPTSSSSSTSGSPAPSSGTT
jgi:RNA polymerase sigma factor (sigma-70 family)